MFSPGALVHAVAVAPLPSPNKRKRELERATAATVASTNELLLSLGAADDEPSNTQGVLPSFRRDQPDESLLPGLAKLCPTTVINRHELLVNKLEELKKNKRTAFHFLDENKENLRKLSQQVKVLEEELAKVECQRSFLQKEINKAVVRNTEYCVTEKALMEEGNTLAYLKGHSPNKKYAILPLAMVREDLSLTTVSSVRQKLWKREVCMECLYTLYHMGLSDNEDFPSESLLYGKGSATVEELQDRIIFYLGLTHTVVAEASSEGESAETVESSAEKLENVDIVDQEILEAQLKIQQLQDQIERKQKRRRLG